MGDDRRSKQVMSMELAMQREAAFHKEMESSQGKQGNKTMKDPPNPKYGTRPTSSSWFKQSQRPANPSSIPKGGRGPRPPRAQAPCLSPMNNMPPQNRNASPRFTAKSGSQSGPFQPKQNSEPTPQQSPKPVIVLPKPYLNQPPGPSIPPRSIPIPDPYSQPSPQTGPSPTANPFPGPIQKRKEAPDQQADAVKGVKMSKLYCELCKVICSSPGNLEDHFKGRKHQSKKKMGEFGSQTETNDPHVLFCELCRVWCMNEFCYDQHLNGKSHVFKLHTAQK